MLPDRPDGLLFLFVLSGGSIMGQTVALRRRQGGFTLVEIAIVLVIIGLLLGGVLKGQELIEQSKIKRVVNDFNNVSAAIMTYQDRYRFLPGDDPNAAARWPNAVGGAAANNGNGGGTLAPATLAQVFTGGGNESGYAWQHLRLTGLVTGDVSTAARSETPEQTPFGSNYGIGLGATAMKFGVVPAFCASLPAKAAEQLDRQLDDGNPQTGNIRANDPTANMNTAPTDVLATKTVYVDDPATPWYTVCRKL
jgi:prepilin-type N-terminal cleavage/methylation domain-containing protein